MTPEDSPWQAHRECYDGKEVHQVRAGKSVVCTIRKFAGCPKTAARIIAMSPVMMMLIGKLSDQGVTEAKQFINAFLESEAGDEAI